MSAGYIHHLVAAADYRAVPAGQPYLPPQFAADGFIHCTVEPEVLLHIANTFYKDVLGEFLVLVIDPARLTAPLCYEPPSPTPADGPLVGRLFPHIYGPLNAAAVVAVRPAQRAADGTFLSL
jgi:uncharacterized protein (DUF952 family)